MTVAVSPMTPTPLRPFTVVIVGYLAFCRYYLRHASVKYCSPLLRFSPDCLDGIAPTLLWSHCALIARSYRCAINE